MNSKLLLATICFLASTSIYAQKLVRSDNIRTGEHTVNAGITLQPPQLNDNPSATIIVNTAGDNKVKLGVSIFKCEIDREGQASRGSCALQFYGYTNREIKVLPGYYLVTAEINSDSSSSTIFSEAPILIRADEIKTLTLKPISIEPTDRLRSVRLGVDYSDSKELIKAVSFVRAYKARTMNGYLSNVKMTCINSSGTPSCGHEEYLPPALQNLTTAYCNGTDADRAYALGEIESNHSRWEILFVGAHDLSRAIQQAFTENRTLQESCGIAVRSADLAAKITVTKKYGERVQYNKIETSGHFFNVTHFMPALNLVRDPTTKKVSWTVDEKRVSSITTFDAANLFSPVEIPFGERKANKSSAYVFPGTYFVVYEFSGNWDNPSNTLMQTQYGQIVE